MVSGDECATIIKNINLELIEKNIPRMFVDCCFHYDDSLFVCRLRFTDTGELCEYPLTYHFAIGAGTDEFERLYRDVAYNPQKFIDEMKEYERKHNTQ